MTDNVESDILKTLTKKQTKLLKNICRMITGVIQLIPPVLLSEKLLHILLSSEYSGFRPSTTAVVTQPVHT